MQTIDPLPEGFWEFGFHLKLYQLMESGFKGYFSMANFNEIVSRASHLVEQYDKYDKFRETEADKVLNELGEPDEIAISRALLRADDMLRYIRWQCSDVVDVADCLVTNPSDNEG